MDTYQQSSLWKNAFSPKEDGFDEQRKKLVFAYEEFRSRVAMLASQIDKDMGNLTIHDITHVDALWWTASEIIGPEYHVNPAEAFVLGGAFLLHDAGHCVAAYPGGIEEIMALPEWQVFCNTLQVNAETLKRGSEAYQNVLFEVLRALHPKQAKTLARAEWFSPEDNKPLHLLDNSDLRNDFADVIGMIAESHWHHPHQLEVLSDRIVQPIIYLSPAPWKVDVFKLALILRVADAAHIDGRRAPRFLLAMKKPVGISLHHWKFQARFNLPSRDLDPTRKELCLSSSPFTAKDQEAWWLAYDAAKLLDSELESCERLLLDHQRQLFAVRTVANIHSTERFSRNVPTAGWHPVDTSVKISNISEIVERFGGTQLYGDEPSLALRELIQNARDAVNACRSLEGLYPTEGRIDVALRSTQEGVWLDVVDTGIGMSRYVLTEVLLDFGKSLWKSSELRGEWEHLGATGFEPVGKFGIGFFSVFMLGSRVVLTTSRYEAKANEAPQWVLDFSDTYKLRPTLREPGGNEKLKRHGTKVSVLLHANILEKLLQNPSSTRKKPLKLSLAEICAQLAPSLDVDLFTTTDGKTTQAIKANDWLDIDDLALLKRISPHLANNSKHIENSTPLHELLNESGKIIGRIGVRLRSHRYTPITCAGSYKGIYTGYVEGITGIINCTNQSDLARHSTHPEITLKEYLKWLAEHVEPIIESKDLALQDHALIAGLGANPKKIIIGTIDGKLINTKELAAHCKGLKTLIHHDFQISFEEDDEVLPSDFRSSLILNDNLLLTDSIAPANWIKKLLSEDPNLIFSISDTIEDTLHLAWKEFSISEKDAVIGTVQGEKIIRNCTVYERM
ncbi:MAG: ATP-binding protein [Candidatus Pseudomonas phytovorans]|uniref:ATP-binding protein n=1 Tax=Candidatus Pseudomonas phytovorans TaxID=3121377 RepID=A0AAJ5WG81_9PSED|nr:ATP-binding protein [Pseudomonas sp.]WEK29129.1 MAG: ATP-binding protein [Pseudomonas sp.]